ncbi:dihydrofolate reductase family protein [Oceanitalea stevensii]|uniref:Dihydrofolate reductase family protein n=1 Tax=Oceanitalea stevensii TaxID=2763072 RepID=A0ABR8YYB1_9MICO|nr:dihydrofolate reductase family protein [Oceanitalea stevensii]MBD8061035.1 dihydrofolate reductase family protein [Oceanitalea stevensii]
MGNLLYVPICSLDGFVSDPDGDHDWAEPSPDVFDFLNELQERISTELYGRRTYEVMSVWETDPTLGESGEHEGDFAEWWQRTEKVVYSTTLTEVTTSRTRLEPHFDPEAVRRLKAESPGDLSVFGPTLAAQAFAAGLVDELHLVLSPMTIGGGLRALPSQRLQLSLLENRRFADSTVHLRYAVGS